MHELLEGLTTGGIFYYSNSGALRRWLSDSGVGGSKWQGKPLLSYRTKLVCPNVKK